jgi:hypothetical protein
MPSTKPYQLLVGAGTLYIAPSATAKPALDATPSGSWRALGFTDGGVKFTKTRKRNKLFADQRTGPIGVTQEEEGVMLETNLQDITLENLADVVGLTVTDIAAGVGTIGYRKVGMYTGSEVSEFAFLFRGKSPYGASMPAQYYVPRGYFDDDVGSEFKKGEKTLIPAKFEVLEDLDTATEAERFGIFEAQDAAALP